MTFMHLQTEGVVFKSFNYGEADLIVCFFTFDEGIVDFFVKSPRKIKSKFGGAFEPCTYCKIEYISSSRELLRLIRCDIIQPYRELHTKYEFMLKVFEIFEMTLNLLPKRHSEKTLLFFLIDTMKSFSDGSHSYNKKLLFYKIKLLNVSGFLPRLRGCAFCGVSESTFFFHEGSIVCNGCRVKVNKVEFTNPMLYLSNGALKMFETVRLWDWKKLDRITPSSKIIDEISKMIDLHLLYQTERTNKTKWFSKRTGIAL